MNRLFLLCVLPFLASCSTARPTATRNDTDAKPAPKLDASAFEKNPKLSPEQLKQKEMGCDKGSVQDCADLVRFHGKNTLGEAFAKDSHRLCALDQVECQLNQHPFPRKSASKTRSGSVIATWSTHYQDEDGPKSFEYRIYQ